VANAGRQPEGRNGAAGSVHREVRLVNPARTWRTKSDWPIRDALDSQISCCFRALISAGVTYGGQRIVGFACQQEEGRGRHASLRSEQRRDRWQRRQWRRRPAASSTERQMHANEC